MLQEGLALPTRALLDVVNNAYAVLVLRDHGQRRSGEGEGSLAKYYYLHNNFALPAEEEDSLVEWGIGRFAFTGIFLAAGGLMLVFLADTWRPALVGVLLVTYASYRTQGVLTNISRFREWEKTECQLIPCGLHGTERIVQAVLLTTVAVADLLDSRVLLLIGLSLATAQVFFMEVVGQMVITWGYTKYLGAFITCFAPPWCWYVFSATLLPLFSRSLCLSGALGAACIGFRRNSAMVCISTR